MATAYSFFVFKDRFCVFSYFCNMDSKLYTTMKQRIILFGLILVGTVTFAQSPVEKGLNTINRSSAEAQSVSLQVMNYRT